MSETAVTGAVIFLVGLATGAALDIYYGWRLGKIYSLLVKLMEKQS